MKNPKPLAIATAEFNKNAHYHFSWMRQNAPIYKARFTGRKPAYLITRYEDVSASLKDPRILKNLNAAQTKSGKRSVWIPKTFRPLLHNMLNTDEPDHRRLRNLVHKAFTPRMIANLEPRIDRIAHTLLDKAAHQEEVDLIQAFALPLPVTVIAEMIGIPEEDRHLFQKWSSAMMVQPTAVNMIKAVPAVRNFLKYTRQLAEKRRLEPKDDLISALALAEEGGDSLTEDELIGMIFLLVLAGHETTVNLIANGTLALLNNPEQLALLKSDYSLMDTAVEEFLRYDGPLQTAEMSFANEEITWHNVTIPKGALILSAIMSANRDETIFDNPNQLDITRTPNKHLAFGHGIHYCLGAPLARLEAKVAFCHLIERFPNLKLAVDVDQLTYTAVPMLHRLKELPIKLNNA